mgnify:CR=1 FL=1
MALTDQRRTFRFPLPHEIVYSRGTVLYAPVYLDGALVAPGSGTVTIYDSANVARVSAAAVTVSGSIAQYTVAASTFTEGEVAELVRAEWTLVFSGTDDVAENDGLVVRRDLHPVLTAADLYRRVRGLDPNNSATITALTAAQQQEKIDEAWVAIVGRMIMEGTRPSYLMSPSSLRRIPKESSSYISRLARWAFSCES